MKRQETISGYRYQNGELNNSHGYLWPKVSAELETFARSLKSDYPRRLFDLGCGNGSIAKACADVGGWSVTGVDASSEGIAQAQTNHSELNLKLGSAYDDLAREFGSFPVVISLEVVEHVYAPRDYAKTLFDLVEPGGSAIISTPYHGYLKNCALALSGKMDAHFTALWDHGHIKFWSFKTISALLEEAGFEQLRFERVGRMRPLAKSMVVIARKP